MKRILPKDTEVSRYFEYKGKIFEEMKIPDGRTLLLRAYAWEDGELMGFGFEYSDGISRKGINPLSIVGIYPKDTTYKNKVLDEFLELSNKSMAACKEVQKPKIACSVCGVQGSNIDKITRWKQKNKEDKQATRYCIKCDNELIIINEVWE